ncbi:hypothetical protein TNIN_242831, partial [Trichonephila inaurata madagascariensis]
MKSMSRFSSASEAD